VPDPKSPLRSFHRVCWFFILRDPLFGYQGANATKVEKALGASFPEHERFFGLENVWFGLKFRLFYLGKMDIVSIQATYGRACNQGNCS
jgi:hypothetical protein